MKARFPELRERTLGTLVLLFWIIGTTGNAATGGGSIDLQSPNADQVIGPARQAGGGFEFRRRLSSIDNPYCAIVTYVLPDFPEQASSTQDADDRSVIVIDASTLKMDRAYSRFLMAHECCHHTLGHTRLTSQRFGQLDPRSPFSTSSRYSKNTELDADSCAVRMLKLTKEFDAIENARKRMLEFGATQTGPYYPTGVERADNIAHIAAEN